MSVDTGTAAQQAPEQAGGSAEEPLADELGTELVRLVKLVERTAAQAGHGQGDGLERAAWGVLFRVHCDGPQRSSALAEALHSDPSTISRHVAALVERGLAERTADPADGRATLVAATPAGSAHARAARARRNAAVGQVVRDWTLDERRTLVHLLHRFTTEFDHARPLLTGPGETQGES
ncbi:MarR family transcriptional regulator [Rhodococcus aerolatus]